VEEEKEEEEEEEEEVEEEQERRAGARAFECCLTEKGQQHLPNTFMW